MESLYLQFDPERADRILQGEFRYWPTTKDQEKLQRECTIYSYEDLPQVATAVDPDTGFLLKYIHEKQQDLLLHKVDGLIIEKRGFPTIVFVNEEKPDSGKSIYVDPSAIRDALDKRVFLDSCDEAIQNEAWYRRAGFMLLALCVSATVYVHWRR